MCKAVLAAEAVDQGRFADIAPADECKFRQAVLRFLLNPGAALDKLCVFDLHRLGNLAIQIYKRFLDFATLRPK